MIKCINTTIFSLLICGLFGCKKTATTPFPADTFFKVYNGNFPKWGNITTRFVTGPTATDASGNIYLLYWNSLGISPSLAIIKTDKYGKVVWNNNYLLYFGGGRPWNYNSNQPFSLSSFICIGQSLYCETYDTSQTWIIATFNCSDGRLNSKIPVGKLLPDSVAGNGNNSNMDICNIWQTNEGNILIDAYYVSPAIRYYKPSLTLMSPAGNILWTKSDFPYPLFSYSDQENGCWHIEFANGDLLYATLAERFISIPPDSTLETNTLVFYRLNGSSGNLLSMDSLQGGSAVYPNGYQNLATHTKDMIVSYSIFPSSAGGYIIAASSQYAFPSLNGKIKLIKTDASFVATDSSYYNGFISSTVQENDGNILASQSFLSYINLYEIAPDLSVKVLSQIGLSFQSDFVTGMVQGSDGHIIMGGAIQTFGLDTNNVFILKTDNNGHY